MRNERSLTEVFDFTGLALLHRGIKGDSHQIWIIQIRQVPVASLPLFLRSSTGPNHPIQPQSLGRVRDPVRIAEGPTAINAATQRRHFGFRLRLVDKLQPIGGAWQRPRREDGKRRVFALHTGREVTLNGSALMTLKPLLERLITNHPVRQRGDTVY